VTGSFNMKVNGLDRHGAIKFTEILRTRSTSHPTIGEYISFIGIFHAWSYALETYTCHVLLNV
jgi:hypothetical protein